MSMEIQLQEGIKVLIDADLILELFINRDRFGDYVEEFFSLIKSPHIEFYITNKCLKRIYIGHDDAGEQSARYIKGCFYRRIIDIDQNIIDKARKSSLIDFDSAEESACVTLRGLDGIVTQNPQNFNGATVQIWSIKDLSTYTHQSYTHQYRSPTPGSTYKTIDRQALVIESISPSKPGKVRFQGVFWRAVCPQNLTLIPGMTVYVVDRQRLELVVEPEEDSSFQKNATG